MQLKNASLNLESETELASENEQNEPQYLEDLKILYVGIKSGEVLSIFRENYPDMEAAFYKSSDNTLKEARKNNALFKILFEKNEKRTKDS